MSDTIEFVYGPNDTDTPYRIMAEPVGTEAWTIACRLEDAGEWTQCGTLSVDHGNECGWYAADEDGREIMLLSVRQSTPFERVAELVAEDIVWDLVTLAAWEAQQAELERSLAELEAELAAAKADAA